MTRLWFVTPVFCDVPSLTILRERILDVVAQTPELAGADVRFVVLDDTAGRDPAIAAIAALDGVDVLTPPFNLGHQRGIVYAVRSLRPQLDDEDVVVTLDADGEDRPSDIPRLVLPLLEDPARRSEVVLAVRARRRYASSRFRGMYWVFRGLFRLLTGTSVRTGNFAAYRGWLAKRLLLHPSFDLCYSSTMLALDTPRRVVECERGARYDGSSRMGYTRLALHALRMLMPFAERIARRMMMVILSTIVLLVALTVVVLAVGASGGGLPGWLAVTLAVAGSVCVIGLGNLIVLFTVFSQSRAVGLSNLEQQWVPPQWDP